jgi:putative transposase
VVHVRQRLGASERQACRVLGQSRSTQRRVKAVRADEKALRTDVVRLASRFGRYGYRQITNLLRIEGWQVNHKRVERIWRQEGLKVPRRQPKRGRLWLTDGSCVRLRPLHKNHVWSYDFVSERTHDGRALKLLTVLDEHTRQCLAIRVARKIRAHDVLEVLADLFVRYGPPEHLRSDNGPEFTAKLARRWLARLGVQTLYEPPRDCRRLHRLRGWGHEHSEKILPGDAGAGRSAGAGRGSAARVAVGGDQLDRA